LFKLFGRWESENINVNDPGLRPYINLDGRLIPRSSGRHRKPFHKSKVHIAERLAQHLLVTGHTGKRHRVTSGPFGGSLYNALDVVERTFEIIEQQMKKNPIEVLVRAIEASALREEVISYQIGSIIAREAVITSPQRRVDRALRALTQGAYRKSFNKKVNIATALAEEIMAAATGKECFALKEKERIEREASGAR
jgi:small subunit ribosomal protein S7